jgi:hypothetical protein
MLRKEEGGDYRRKLLHIIASVNDRIHATSGQSYIFDSRITATKIYRMKGAERKPPMLGGMGIASPFVTDAIAPL